MIVVVTSLAVCLFLLAFVALLLVLQKRLLPQGNATITVNDQRELTVATGDTLITALSGHGIILPSSCGGKGNCGQCRCRVTAGAGEALPIESNFFTRQELGEGWRLGCQFKVRGNIGIALPQSILDAKEYRCTVVSNRNVASFIKELKVQLPAEAGQLDFRPGSYALLKIPAFKLDFNDIDREQIGSEYLPAWEERGLFGLRCTNDEATTRAYSMANYPAEGNVFMLTVRIATPPQKRNSKAFADVNPGIGSSYIFSLKAGDKVDISGPFGDFHITEGDRERIWIGGGAGMAPLRSQIMHLTRTLQDTTTPMHFFYGARALNEVLYLDDFMQLQRDFDNFHFHLALDRQDPVADRQNISYTQGFVHQMLYDTYLKAHPEPEEVHYYLCGPPMMTSAVLTLLDNLGVAPNNISYDNFGN
ncbi:MAG: NADH:ubiquinone reductase (Na(+)-transporting) subunit F [Bacteroidales bacterium]|nr:NADH:ubiquinone reductase (Na(+)-transporting) subunit F [Bacteroidales bacterium]